MKNKTILNFRSTSTRYETQSTDGASSRCDGNDSRQIRQAEDVDAAKRRPTANITC